MGGGWPQPLVGLALLATPVARDVRRIFGMFITNLLLFHMAKENYPCVDHFRIKHCLFPWLPNLKCGSPCPMLLFFFHGCRVVRPRPEKSKKQKKGSGKGSSSSRRKEARQELTLGPGRSWKMMEAMREALFLNSLDTGG